MNLEAYKMTLWTEQEIYDALGLPLGTPYGWSAAGISIDTRTLKRGDLFVAIKGDDLDGHDYVADAFVKGAVAAIVAMPLKGGHCLVVPDTLRALQQLAEFSRDRTQAKVICLTGSAGKTTTKEMIRTVLEAFGKTSFSQASYNNHWGLPLSLSQMSQDAKYGVFEMGTNHKGEIAPLSLLAKPDIAVITTIAPAHVGLMGSTQAIAEEKSEIFRGMKPGGMAILPKDSSYFDYLAERAKSMGVEKIISFGKCADASVQLLDYLFDPQEGISSVHARIFDQEVSYTLLLKGEHLALDSLIVLAIANVFNLDFQMVCDRLSRVEPLKGRGAWHKILSQKGDFTLIDDAYNANLSSMKAGLSVLAATSPQPKGRRIAVLGEMRELGDKSRDHHLQIAKELKRLSIDCVFVVGAEAECLFEALPSTMKGGYALKAETLLPLIESEIAKGDVVFVKGSKGSKVSHVVDFFVERASNVKSTQSSAV